MRCSFRSSPSSCSSSSERKPPPLLRSGAGWPMLRRPSGLEIGGRSCISASSLVGGESSSASCSSGLGIWAFAYTCNTETAACKGLVPWPTVPGALHAAGWVAVASGLVTVVASLIAWNRPCRSLTTLEGLIAERRGCVSRWAGVIVGSWRRPAPNPRFRRSRRRPKRGQRGPRALGMPVACLPCAGGGVVSVSRGVAATKGSTR